MITYAFCYAVLCRVALRYAVLYCVVYCSGVQCSAVLCYTILCYTVLYCAELCYTVHSARIKEGNLVEEAVEEDHILGRVDIVSPQVLRVAEYLFDVYI